jgi:hypothetical protein
MALKIAGATRRTHPAQLWLWSTPDPKPDFYVGIHPTKYCLARLNWAISDCLPNLLSAVHAGICTRELYEAAVQENPAFTAELCSSVADAAWELNRYGCLLIPRRLI